jgi:hypothetical protein
MFYVLGAHRWMLRGARRQADPEIFSPVAAKESAERQIEAAKAVCGPVRRPRQLPVLRSRGQGGGHLGRDHPSRSGTEDGDLPAAGPGSAQGRS